MNIWLLSFLIWNFQAEWSPPTSFAMGKYAGSEGYPNDLNLNKSLTLPEAQAIQVTVEGQLEEGYDFLTLYDGKRKKIRRLTGHIQERFTIKGSTLYLNFFSDSRTQGPGIKVSIASSSLINEVKTRLIDASEQILKGGTKESYQKIADEFIQWTPLQNLAKTQPLDTLIEQLVRRLMALTKIYRELGNKNQEILAFHQAQFRLIEELRNEVSTHMNKLQQEREKYLVLLKEAQNKLTDLLLSEVESQKEQLSIEVYQKVLTKMDVQQKSWQAFKKEQSLLETKLKKYSESVGLFLYFLKVNAQLYEQAANTLLMKKNNLTELRELMNLTELQKIVDDLLGQEEEIKVQINQIQQSKPDELK